MTDLDRQTVASPSTLDVTPAVELDAVSKTYPGLRPVDALVDIDLRIDRGDYVAIMGPSGSGKSTLLNVLGLLDEPTCGDYRLAGQPTANLSERKRCGLRAHEIGFVFQSFHLVAYRSAVENVETGLLYQALARRQRRRKAIDVLERVGLAERMWATPPELSGGERQRVAIARALVRLPTLILCDEPTGNLDTATGEQILQLLDELNTHGHTIINITHDPTIAAHAHHTINIHDGRLTSNENQCQKS